MKKQRQLELLTKLAEFSIDTTEILGEIRSCHVLTTTLLDKYMDRYDAVLKFILEVTKEEYVEQQRAEQAKTKGNTKETARSGSKREVTDRNSNARTNP